MDVGVFMWLFDAVLEVCEIGSMWYVFFMQWIGVNMECKFLMLIYVFDVW